MLDLQTERLSFRQWRKSDYAELANFYSIEENARYVGGQKTAEEASRLMATYVGHYQLHGYSYLAIEVKDSKQLIGTVGLWNSDPWPEPELGYWLLPKAQGKGYGLEAGLAVKNFALDTLQLPSLVSYIYPTNLPSIKLAERLGAQYDETINLLDFGEHKVYRYK